MLFLWQTVWISLYNSSCYLSDLRRIFFNLPHFGQLQVWHQRWQAAAQQCLRVALKSCGGGGNWSPGMTAKTCAALGIKFWSAFSCSLCASTWAPRTILCSLTSLKVTGFFWCKQLTKGGIKLLLEAEFWWRLHLSALIGQMSHLYKFGWNLTQEECIAGVSSVSYWLHNVVFYKTSISLSLLFRAL